MYHIVAVFVGSVQESRQSGCVALADVVHLFFAGWRQFLFKFGWDVDRPGVEIL